MPQRDNEQQYYRRNLDREYVTRHEWDMHLRESERALSGLQTHLAKQDEDIEKLQGTLAKALGAATVIILVGQSIVAWVISRL